MSGPDALAPVPARVMSIGKGRGHRERHHVFDRVVGGEDVPPLSAHLADRGLPDLAALVR